MPFRISLRSMAVLVGRAKMIKAGEGRETARRLGREQLIFELIFLAALPLVLARFARISWLPGSCARLDKTAMLRWLIQNNNKKRFAVFLETKNG